MPGVSPFAKGFTFRREFRLSPGGLAFRLSPFAKTVSPNNHSYATEAAPAEKVKLPPPGNKEVTNARVASIVDQISSLTLIETAELVQALKTRLNIQDVALPAVSNVANVAVPASEAAAPVEEEKAPEKTAFTVKLEKYNADAKTKIIREMKNILPGTNLVEAKKFVESVPKVIKENVNKEEAEKIKKTLEGLGATVILE